MLIEGGFRAIAGRYFRVAFLPRRARRRILSHLQGICSTMPQHVLSFLRPRIAWIFAFVGYCAVNGLLLAGQPAASRDFNGPETSWEVVDARNVGRVLTHECVPGGARDQSGFERVVLAIPGGEAVQLVCPVAPVAVIDELEVRLWVKASRPDIQLAARARLPRTEDGEGDADTSLIVRGEKYTRAGHWQQLVLKSVPDSLAAETRVLRSMQRVEVDRRQAYVDAVVLIIPGDPQGVEVATDDLVVHGVPRIVPDAVQLTSYPAAAYPAAVRQQAASPAAETPTAPTIGARLRRLPEAGGAAASLNNHQSVRMQGSVFLVGDRPFLPRAIRWQGEPPEFLAERGFNVLWLDELPTAEQCEDARRHDLWFLCAPPRPEAIANAELGQVGDRVIGWMLEDPAIATDPGYAARWADLVRQRDEVSGRPVIVMPQNQWAAVSKSADAVVATRTGIGPLSAEKYAHWLEGVSRAVRPGTPLWACMRTQFPEHVVAQMTALSGTPAESDNADGRQLEEMVRTATRHGVRGFLFESRTPLSEADVTTRARITNLELINRRLQRLEPWLASGKMIGRVSSSDGALDAIMLRVDQAELMIPLIGSAGAATSGRDATFVIPGVPESCQIYSWSPVALRVLPMQRVAGGTRISLRPDEATVVLMTEDPNVLHGIRQQVNRYGNRVVRLERDRAALRLAAYGEIARGFGQAGIDTASIMQSAATVAGLLRQVDGHLASHQLEQAHQAALVASGVMNQTADELRRAAGRRSSLVSNPLSLSDERLAEFAAFERAYPGFKAGDNLLYGGDFEDLGALTQFGWRNYQRADAAVGSAAELSTMEPRHGSYCLMLKAGASSDTPSTAGEVSVWVEAPPIPVTAGQVLEIIGWTRVDGAATSESAELTIADSLGGEELAISTGVTNGWEQFRLTRAVPESTELRLTFALAGSGMARIDAVMARPVEQPATRRLPVLAPATGPMLKLPPTNAAATNAPASPVPAPAPVILRQVPAAAGSASGASRPFVAP